MSGRQTACLVCALAFALGGECGGGEGDGGDRSVQASVRLQPNCPVVPEKFPPGLALLPSDENVLIVLNDGPSGAFAFDVATDVPFQRTTPPTVLVPDDSDLDGVDEGSVAVSAVPILDGIVLRDPALSAAGIGLLTASGYEEVMFFRPGQDALVVVDVEVPASVRPGDYPRLPAPGTGAARTAVSTTVCLKPLATIDSRGDDYAAGVPQHFFCDPAVRGSFFANFTSGAAVAAGRLFVSTSNAGGGLNTSNTQYLPGSVLVYDLDLTDARPRVSPHATTPAIFTTGFNPVHVTRYAVGARELLLVSNSGANGVDPNSPNTLLLSDASIDVIDASTLALVGSYPLGRAGIGFDRVAIDASGRVGAVGGEAGREIYAVDLAPLAALPANGPAVDLSADVLFDANAPFRIPALAGVSPDCAGATLGTAFSADAAEPRLYVTERCDGTFTTIAVTLPPTPADPFPRTNFFWVSTTPVVAPLGAAGSGIQKDPGFLRVRSGRPGIDFNGPDVFFTVGQPEGAVCAVHVAPR